MSSPFLFCPRKFPFIVIIGRRFGPYVIPRLFPTAQSIKGGRQSTSSSIDRGPPFHVPLLCHHRLSCIGSGTIDFCREKSPAAPSNFLAGLSFQTKPYHTDLKAIGAPKLSRWDTWLSLPNFRRKQTNQNFGLRHLSSILDEKIFEGLLRNCVLLRWVEAPMGKLDWLGRTTLISDAKRGPCTLIEVMKPLPNGPWTHKIMQERLDAVLYELTRVYFLMYIRNCVPYQRSNNRAASGRQPGHGSLFSDLLQKVEQEANRKLRGLPRPWQLRRSPRR